MRRALAPLIAVLGLLACDGPRRVPVPATPARPSCALPECGSCACDTTTTCDGNCTCDPECGRCRAPEAPCATPRDAGPAPEDGGMLGLRDAAPRVDAGPCLFPATQGLSEPCCIDRGIDACGAGLFCEAFDGRTQPTCYAERSRVEGQSCSADLHCARGRCPASTQVCGPGPGDRCTPGGQPCAPGPDGRPSVCDPLNDVCVPARLACDIETQQPCNASESCTIIFEETSEPSTSCVSPGRQPAGAGCEWPDDCARGLTCIPPIRICVPVCAPNLPCASGACVRVSGPNSPPLGVCEP